MPCETGRYRHGRKHRATIIVLVVGASDNSFAIACRETAFLERNDYGFDDEYQAAHDRSDQHSPDRDRGAWRRTRPRRGDWAVLHGGCQRRHRGRREAAVAL